MRFHVAHNVKSLYNPAINFMRSSATADVGKRAVRIAAEPNGSNGTNPFRSSEKRRVKRLLLVLTNESRILGAGALVGC